MIVAIGIPMFVYIFVYVFQYKWLVPVVFLGPLELLAIAYNDKIFAAIRSLALQMKENTFRRV